MANSKKFELSKKDMNFFSEFSASAGQIGSYMSLALLILLGLLIAGGAVYAVVLVQTTATRSSIDSLTNKMNSESYQSQLLKYSELNKDMSGLNQKYYDVSSLFSRVQNTDKVVSANMDVVQSNLPKDVVITNFDYSDGTIIIKGSADSYYSPLDMVANFSKAKLFTYVDITSIKQIDFGQSSLTQEELKFKKRYSFEIHGYLKSTYVVLISRLLDAAPATPLAAIKTQTLGIGEQYTETGVTSFADGTNTYNLSRVLINGVAVTDAQFKEIQTSNTVSGIISESVDIKLFYTLAPKGGQ